VETHFHDDFFPFVTTPVSTRHNDLLYVTDTVVLEIYKPILHQRILCKWSISTST